MSTACNARNGLPSLARVALTLLAATAFVPGFATAAPASLERLDRFLGEVQTLSGGFRQTLYDDSDRALETSAGEVHLERSAPHGRFRWRYTEPYPQLIVGDGQQVWVYDPDLEQVTVRPLDSALGDTPAALLAGNADITDRFELRDLGEREGVAWVSLTPLAGPEGGFQSMALGFSGEALAAMELVDAFGQRTVLEFGTLTRNAPIDDAMFRFEPPAGADVLRE